MAIKFENISGSYNQKSVGGDKQASNKYGNCNHPSTDKGTSSQKINPPTDSDK